MKPLMDLHAKCQIYSLNSIVLFHLNSCNNFCMINYLSRLEINMQGQLFWDAWQIRG